MKIELPLAWMRDVDEQMKSTNEYLKRYNGMVARIPRGFYKGRWGKISSIHLSVEHDSMNVVCLVRPFNLKDPTDLLNEKTDARTYWNAEDLEEVYRTLEEINDPTIKFRLEVE